MAGRGSILDPLDRLLTFRIAAVFIILAVGTPLLHTSLSSFGTQEEIRTQRKNSTHDNPLSIPASSSLLIRCALLTFVPGFIVWIVLDQMLLLCGHPLLLKSESANQLSVENNSSSELMVEGLQRYMEQTENIASLSLAKALSPKHSPLLAVQFWFKVLLCAVSAVNLTSVWRAHDDLQQVSLYEGAVQQKHDDPVKLFLGPILCQGVHILCIFSFISAIFNYLSLIFILLCPKVVLLPLAYGGPLSQECLKRAQRLSPDALLMVRLTICAGNTHTVCKALEDAKLAVF